MKARHVAILIAVLVLTLGGTTWADEPHFDFVGLSQGTALGNAGIIRMHQLCHATFPGSRMCTSRDIQLSVNPPTIQDSGWVQPIYVPYHSEPGVFDISGIGLITQLQGGLITTPRSLSCFGWSSPSGDTFGLSLSGNGSPGQWNIIQCSFTASKVACCGPTNPSARRTTASTTTPPRR